MATVHGIGRDLQDRPPRHSAARAALEDGASLKAIGTMLRHRSIETSATYAKVDLDALSAAVDSHVELMQACGFVFDTQATRLASFAAFAEARGETHKFGRRPSWTGRVAPGPMRSAGSSI